LEQLGDVSISNYGRLSIDKHFDIGRPAKAHIAINIDLQRGHVPQQIPALPPLLTRLWFTENTFLPSAMCNASFFGSDSDLF